MNKIKKQLLEKDERGFALLLVIFIISLATIIVTLFSTETFSFIKLSRATTDSITADYAAQSALEVALSVLEIPDDPSSPQQPWQLLNAMPTLPIPGFVGDIRVQVIDQNALINVNAISSPPGFGGGGGGASPSPTPDPNGADPQSNNIAEFWKFALVTLFNGTSFSSFSDDSNNGPKYGPEQQVAVITDFIDSDKEPSTTPASGNEGSDQNNPFPNRALKTIDELGRVPGLSKSYLQFVSQYLRVGPISDYKVNINTADPVVLKALGFQDTELSGIIDQRQAGAISAQEFELYVPPSSSLARVTSTVSATYKILVRAKTVSATRWLEAEVVVQSGFGKKVSSIRSSRAL